MINHTQSGEQGGGGGQVKAVQLPPPSPPLLHSATLIVLHTQGALPTVKMCGQVVVIY